MSLLLSIILSILYSLIVFVLNKPLQYLLGADNDTIHFAEEYLFWVVIIGSLPSVVNYSLSHLIRATGKSQSASIGIAMGGIINIILDPLFIFVFKSPTFRYNILVVCNFTPVASPDIRVGVPKKKQYKLIMNEQGLLPKGKAFKAEKKNCDNREFSFAYPLEAYGVGVFTY